MGSTFQALLHMCYELTSTSTYTVAASSRTNLFSLERINPVGGKAILLVKKLRTNKL